jgi:hypothetical protein
VGAGHLFAVQPGHLLKHRVLVERGHAGCCSGSIQPMNEVTSSTGMRGTQRAGHQGAGQGCNQPDLCDPSPRHAELSEVLEGLERSGGTLRSSIGWDIGTGLGVVEKDEQP